MDDFDKWLFNVPWRYERFYGILTPDQNYSPEENIKLMAEFYGFKPEVITALIQSAKKNGII